MHPRRLLLTAALLLLLVPGSAWSEDETDPGLLRMLEQRLPEGQMQEVRFLEYLGWRFVRDPSIQEIRFEGGFPCRYETLEAAHASGALRIRFPEKPTAQQFQAFGRRAPVLADAIVSRCAYKLKIARAVERAVTRLEKLTESGRYKFPDYLFGAVDSPWFKVGLPRPAWVLRERVWYAADSATAAIRSLYERGAVAECYAGQAIAVYAIQYELYGPEAFDKAFKGDDLAVGRPPDIKSSPIGRYTKWDGKWPYRALLIPPADQKKDVVFPLGRHGRMAFVGLSGIVRNQVADVRSNENFICTSISERALADLLQKGGRRYVSDLMKEVWEAAAPGRGLFASSSAKRAASEKVDALLAKPILSEWMLYVHPFGNISLADVARKKLDQVDTPVMIVFYDHGREDALFQRFRDAFKRGWLTPTGSAVPTGMRRGR